MWCRCQHTLINTVRYIPLPARTGTINDLPSEVDILSLSDASREPYYFSPSSSFSFSRIPSSSLASVRYPQSILSSREANKQSYNCRSECPPEPLPSRSMGIMLFKTYFTNIHPQYPFLHTIIRRYEIRVGQWLSQRISPDHRQRARTRKIPRQWGVRRRAIY